MFSLAGLGPPRDVKTARGRISAIEADNGDDSDRPGEKEDNGRAKSGRRLFSKFRSGRDKGATVLDVKDLWYRFDSGCESADALRGIDLRVDRGEMVAIVGRNGAGKSTLLRHFGGLLEPARGRVGICGRNPAEFGRGELNEHVALLLQNPNDYLLADTVEEEFPAGHAERVLSAAGLSDCAKAHPHDLSVGQRQRLALAILLSRRGWPDGDPPPLIALDEPTRGLDRKRKVELAGILRELAGRGAAVVVATHDVELAALFAARAVMIAEGRIIADGPASEIFSSGLYYTTDVARALGSRYGCTLAEEGADILKKMIAHDQEVVA